MAGGGSEGRGKGSKGPPRTQEDLESYLPYLVNRLASFGQAAQNRKLSATGVNIVTLRALSVLHIHGWLTVNEIAARAFAEQSTASRAVDAMVAAGLVERRVSSEDQRRRELALTDQGRAVLHDNWPIVEAHYALLSEGIAPEAIATCRAVLLRMIDNLKKGES